MLVTSAHGRLSADLPFGCVAASPPAMRLHGAPRYGGLGAAQVTEIMDRAGALDYEAQIESSGTEGWAAYGPNAQVSCREYPGSSSLAWSPTRIVSGAPSSSVAVSSRALPSSRTRTRLPLRQGDVAEPRGDEGVQAAAERESAAESRVHFGALDSAVEEEMGNRNITPRAQVHRV